MSKGEKDDSKPSISFQEMCERRKFSVPDEAHKLFTELLNPFESFIEKFRAGGMTEQNIKQLIYLVDTNVGYYKRKLECLKILASFSHAKPVKASPAIPEPPPGEKKPPDPNNPYADMTTEQLIAGLPTTNEQFDSGPTQPGS